MEVLYSQSFSWARITPYKDHCRLSDKDQNRNIKSIQLPNKKYAGKKNVCYFYSDFDENNEPVEDMFFFSKRRDVVNLELFRKDKIEHFDTRKQRQINRHFGRPLSSVYLNFYERSIIKRDHKIQIKFKKYIKYRDVNKKYFKENVISTSIIIDTRNGNFQTVSFTKNGKSKTSKIRTNGFNKLKESLNEILKVNRYFVDRNNRYEKELKQIFSDKEFKKNIFKSLDLETTLTVDKIDSKELFSTILNYFIVKKEIKVPNVNYVYLLTYYYPTEKYLKKNKRKLVASILDMFGFKSKQTIKLLHEYPNMDVYPLISVCLMFGKEYNEYLANVNKLVFQISNSKPILDDGFGINSTSKHFVFNILNNSFEYTKDEKKFILRILNCVEHITSTNVLNENFLIQLRDHINMYRKISVYDRNLKIRARNFDELRTEHMEFSKLNSMINKGWVLEYQFDQKTIDEIEKVYEVTTENGDKIILSSHLLKREEEYIEEGNFMHHCVASYADKDKSIIVSIRTDDKNDRITIEFDIQTGTMIQARYFCNGQPPVIYHKPLSDLKEKISRMARFGTLNWKEKKKVQLKINGIEINKIEVETLF